MLDLTNVNSFDNVIVDNIKSAQFYSCHKNSSICRNTAQDRVFIIYHIHQHSKQLIPHEIEVEKWHKERQMSSIRTMGPSGQ